MATIHYTAKVKGSRLLELPEDAQALGLKRGEEVHVSMERNGIEGSSPFPPNEQGLTALREIAERQKERPTMEGSDVVKLVRESRMMNGTDYRCGIEVG